MATDTPTRPQLTTDLTGVLTSLRGRIRSYVWIEGLAIVVAALGAAFWFTLLLDQPWAWEPPREVRVVFLGAAAVAFLWLVYRYILRRAFVSLSDRSMALLLERKFAGLDDSLLTAVEYSNPLTGVGTNPDMLAHTYDEARVAVRGLRVGEVFDYRPLARAVLAAVLLTASVVGFALARPTDFGIWYRRTVLLSAELWPRKTELIVEGFDADGRAKIARGADFPLIVKANTEKLVPDSVQVRYRYDEGSRGRETLTREGKAQPGVDPYQEFSHTFQGVLTSMQLDVLGGDDRKRNLRIEVVDSPTVTEMSLHVSYPKYMQREPRTLAVTGAMQLPEGANVELHAQLNKDVEQVEIATAAGDKAADAAVVLRPGESGSDPRAFNVALGELQTDRAMLFTLLDRDGIRNREPIRLTIGITPDAAPQVSVQLRGIGSAITPMARLPAVGQMTDDFGIASAWFEYIIDEKGESSGRIPLHAAPRGRDEIVFGEHADEALDVRDQLIDAEEERLTLKPGQKLQVAVKAEDAYDLGAAPHIGSSQRFLLDVVTPDQLRTLLESRELNLRQRFETIIGEVTETSEALTRLDFAAAAATGDNAPAASPAAVEPDDEAAPAVNTADLTKLRVERTQQNSRKNAQETVGVAASFEEIAAELVNNRVDTEELKLRLTEGISEPLRRIGEEMMPELEQRLDALRKQLAESTGQTEARDRAREQADAVLVEMRQVLTRMLELETFNEALTMLRGIIESQDKINTLTEELRKKKAKALLDD